MITYVYDEKTGLKKRVKTSRLHQIGSKGKSVTDSSNFRQRDDLVRHYFATGKINTSSKLVYDEHGDAVLGDIRSKRNDVVDTDILIDTAMNNYDRKIKHAQHKAEVEKLDNEYKKLKEKPGKTEDEKS